MSIGEKITLWISEDGSYQEGIGLLEELGQPTYQEETWLSRSYIPNAIQNQLREKLSRFRSEKKPTSLFSRQQPVIPEIISNYKAKGRLLMKEYSEAKGRLNMMCAEADRYTDQERYELAAFIMDDLNPRIDEVYNAIRRYEDTGEIPVPVQHDIVKETVQKMQRLQTLGPRLSRLRKWLKNDNLEEVTRAKYEKELKEKEAEQESLQIQLGV